MPDPSDQDIQDALGGHQQAANAALVGVQGIPPQAAAIASSTAATTGIPGSVGMYSPDVVDTAHREAQQRSALANPSVASWVATAPPEHVAAVQDDLSALGQMSQSLDQWKAKGGVFGDWNVAWKRFVAGTGQLQNDFNTARASGDLLGQAKAVGEDVWSGAGLPFTVGLAPLNEAIGQKIFNAPDVQLPEWLVNALVSKEGQAHVLAMTPEQRAQGSELAAQLLTGTAAMLHGGEGGPQAARGPGPRGSEGEGKPQPTPSGPQRLLAGPPSVGVDEGFDVLRTEMAKQDTDSIAQVQESIAQSGLQDKAPDALSHFLDEQTAGQMVSVDADKLADLAAQGHEPFPNRAQEIALAAAQGRDVEIPAGQYLAATSGQPFAAELNGATTFREGGVAAEEKLPQAPTVAAPSTEGLEFPGLSDAEHERVRYLAERNTAEVEAVFKSQFLAPLFKDAKALGMTADQMERFASGLESIQQLAHQRAIEAAVKQVRAERGPEFKEAAARHEARLKGEIEALPNVRAMKALGEKGFKLDRDYVQSFHPGLADQLPDSIMRKGGNHPANAAEALGYFDSGQLVQAMADLHSAVKASGSKGLQDFINRQAKASARDAASNELGYSTDPTALRERAMEMVPEDQIERFLTDELRVLGERTGFALDVDRIKADAARSFGQLQVREAINPAKIEKDVYRAGEKALRAMGKDDLPRAFRYRQIQFYRRLQLAQSFKFQREYAKGDRALRQWSKGSYNGDPEMKAVLEELAWQMGYEPARDAVELQRYMANSRFPTTGAAVREVQGSGIPIEDSTIPAMVRAQANGKVAPLLPVDTFRSFMNMANALAKYGREAQVVEMAGKRSEMNVIAGGVQARAADLGAKYTPAQLITTRRGVFTKLKDATQAILVANLRPETYLYWMDGETWGPLMDSVVGPLQEGKHQERALTDRWAKKMRSLPDEYFKAMKEEIRAPDFMRSQVNEGNPPVIENRGSIRTALLHLGSETARTKLLDGYGWGEPQEQWLLAQATEEDKDFLRAFWDQNEERFALADKMYGRVRGYGLEADPARTVTFPDGSTMPGGHVHIVYNQILLDNARANGENHAPINVDGDDVLGLHPASSLPSAFYGVRRTGFVGPVDLDYLRLSAGVSEVIHDIAFREALVQAQKVLTDPRVRDALRTTMGDEYTKQLIPWMRYIAQQRIIMDPTLSSLTGLVRNMSNNFTWAEIAYNLSSFLKHSSIGMFVHVPITTKGDFGGLLQASLDLLGPGEKARGWRKFVDEQMPEVGQLSKTFDSSLIEAIDADQLKSGAVAKYKQYGYALLSMSKQWEGRIVALTTYRQEMAKVGDHGQAVQVAQKAVRDSQGVGHPVDTPRMLRHTGEPVGEVFRMLFGLFMSFRNASFNYMWRAQQKVELGARLMADGRTGEGLAAMRDGLNTGVALIAGTAGVVALVSTVLAGRRERTGKNHKGTAGLAQSAAEEFAWGTLDATAGNIPLLAPAVEALHYKNTNDSPGGTMAKEAGAAGQDILAMTGHGKAADQHPLLDALSLVGQLTGLVPVSAAHAAQAVSDQLNPASRLKPEDRTPVALAQRALLNRSPQYVPAARKRAAR